MSGLARSASAPVSDLCLVNEESCGLIRSQPKRRARRTIHIGSGATGAADRMVVIIAHAVFVKRRGAGGLDAPDQPFFHQNTESVIHRLAGNCANLRSHRLCNGLRRAVWPASNRPHHRQALGSDGDFVLTEDICWLTHKGRFERVLDTVKILLASD